MKEALKKWFAENHESASYFEVYSAGGTCADIDRILEFAEQAFIAGYEIGQVKKEEKILKPHGVLSLYREADEDATVVFSFTGNLEKELRYRVFKNKRVPVRLEEVKGLK